jgi:DNA-binding YbaB/EbfC family protein
MSELLERAREAQQKLQGIQQELAARRFEGSAGGGMVTAYVSGALRVLEIQVEPSLYEGGDRSLLQDLTAAAVNAALTNAQQGIQQEMMRAGLSIPGLGGPGS